MWFLDVTETFLILPNVVYQMRFQREDAHVFECTKAFFVRRWKFRSYVSVQTQDEINPQVQKFDVVYDSRYQDRYFGS